MKKNPILDPRNFLKINQQVNKQQDLKTKQEINWIQQTFQDSSTVHRPKTKKKERKQER
jgi:hypothetical protein